MATKESWITRRANGNGTAWNKGKKMPEICGINSPKYSSVEKVCKQCKQQFIVRNYRKDTANFCSQDCSHLNRRRGNTTADERARRAAAQKRWRKAIFERDGYACVECGDSNYQGRGKTVVLQADHIKPFALYPELRLELDNGRTLCVDCHKKTNTYGPKSWRKVCIATA